MSEPELIRNTAPREISMPVGGRNAMSKSAHVGEPTIYRVLAEDNADLTAPPAPAENSPVPDTPPEQRKAATFAVDETANPVAPAKDQRTDSWRALVAPLPQAPEHAIAVALNIAAAADQKAQISDELAARLVSEHAIAVADLKAQISDELALRLASEHAIAVAGDHKAQISDGLAARLAALKTENDQVLEQLDGLEKLLGHQP